MLNTAKNYVENAPWMAVWPGVSIFLLVLRSTPGGAATRRPPAHLVPGGASSWCALEATTDASTRPDPAQRRDKVEVHRFLVRAATRAAPLSPAV
jgi:hypothetical protein